MRRMKNEIVKNLSVFGNAFFERRYNARTVMKHVPLDPRYVTIITDSDLVPIRYAYNPPRIAGTAVMLSPDDVLHIVDDWFSPITEIDF